ncbi:hypothetical protein CR513_02706, partial [Mucuna pruriens]
MQGSNVRGRQRCRGILGLGDEGGLGVGIIMVSYEFSGYALVWWNEFCREVREGRRRHFDTWLDLRRETRSRFVPTDLKA